MSTQWEDEFNQLCRAMGAALSSWQHVETACFEVFTCMLGGAPSSVCAMIFYSIESFDLRRIILGRMLQEFSTKSSARRRWQKLDQKLKEQNENRVKLAHYGIDFKVVKQRDLPDGGVEVEFRQPRLETASTNLVHKVQGRSPDRPGHSLTFSDINQYTFEFAKLAIEVGGFVARLRAMIEPPKVTLAQLLALDPAFPPESSPPPKKPPQEGA